MTTNYSINHIVDLQRYPITDLESDAGKHCIAHCTQQLSNNGLCLLPDFIQADALLQMQSTALSLSAEAHPTEHWRATPNGDANTPDRKLKVETRASMSSVGYDRLGSDSALRQLYSAEKFTAFINALFDGPELFITADPLIGCMLTYMSAGDELGWHYDPNDIVVSLSLQQAEDGGEFEFAPRIRHPAADAQENEDAVLAGCYENLVRKSLVPATLSLFNGYHSLHRVAPVDGNQQRIIALFNYSQVPYYSFETQIHERFFGRVAGAQPA